MKKMLRQLAKTQRGRAATLRAQPKKNLSPREVCRKAGSSTYGGLPTVVEGAPQTGKSALRAKAYAFAGQNNLQACYLDFQLFDSAQLASLTTLFRGVAKKLAMTFKTSLMPQECWDAAAGAKENLTHFIEEAILAKTEAPILLIMDQADLAFKFPYCNDIFAAIRGWHNRRILAAICAAGCCACKSTRK
jgi:hypothetical protein